MINTDFSLFIKINLQNKKLFRFFVLSNGFTVDINKKKMGKEKIIKAAGTPAPAPVKRITEAERVRMLFLEKGITGDSKCTVKKKKTYWDDNPDSKYEGSNETLIYYTLTVEGIETKITEAQYVSLSAIGDLDCSAVISAEAKNTWRKVGSHNFWEAFKSI